MLSDLHPPQILSGISEISDKYDGFLLDMWGVIHDGVKLYPTVIETLSDLKAKGKKLVILSNAPRRAESVADTARKLGLPANLYDDIMTSGEASWRQLAQGQDSKDPWIAKQGTKLFHMGPERDKGMLVGLPQTIVENLDQAELVLLTGVYENNDTLDQYEESLQYMAEKQIPLVCANPDLEVMRGDERELCAGSLAKRLEELGGDVRAYGKPHPLVYDAAFKLFDNIAPAKILAVGDGLYTDIRGANTVGIDSYFIPGGVHCRTLEINYGEIGDMDKVMQLMAALQVRPTYIAPRLCL